MNSKEKEYWDQRYQELNTPWDIGYASTPLVEYFDQLENKTLDILIPGCGNGYEAIDLYNKEFNNTHVIDLSQLAIHALKQKVHDKFHDQLIVGDYFEHDKQYDLIVEQTFFCALHPDQRDEYVKKTHELLKDDGKLMGLLFNIPLNTEHPPYGGTKEEYIQRFKPYFDIEVMEAAHNSIKPRLGNELFVLMKKKAV